MEANAEIHYINRMHDTVLCYIQFNSVFSRLEYFGSIKLKYDDVSNFISPCEQQSHELFCAEVSY